MLGGRTGGPPGGVPAPRGSLTEYLAGAEHREGHEASKRGVYGERERVRGRGWREGGIEI